MSQLNLDIGNKGWGRLPTFEDDMAEVVIVRFGANRRSKSCLEIQRRMEKDPEYCVGSVALVNGDYFRITRVRALNIELSKHEVIISLEARAASMFDNISRIVISHSLSAGSLKDIKETLLFMFRGLKLELSENI